MSKNIITIGCQCGSGGHTIGKLVAERLGVPFYDKELIKIVAERSGLSEKTIERDGEYHTPSLLYSIAVKGFSVYSVDNKNNMVLHDQINAYQTELIRELAEAGPCVIVGRCADYILEDSKDCLRVFVHGKLEDRANRVIHEHGIAEKEAERHVRERDKKRSRYYKHLTDRDWGAAENYNLFLDSSCLGIERCVDVILGCAE